MLTLTCYLQNIDWIIKIKANLQCLALNILFVYSELKYVKRYVKIEKYPDKFKNI